ncbi:NAD(P)/FAD-dependent oxidoreductase [Nocardia sp. NPDC127606]|uniref:NAD(P)/FAD-dependent oxidoreductase n=1 Tax=Nocardia sp. NPDC127606 TaxID=3345406 RepID=UPI00364034EF
MPKSAFNTLTVKLANAIAATGVLVNAECPSETTSHPETSDEQTLGARAKRERRSMGQWVTEVETEPIDPARLAALGWTSRSGLITQHNIMENYRLTARNTIVFGVRQIERAAGYPLPERHPEPAVVADRARAFERRFPPLADVAIDRAWGGWIGITSTWLPVAGTVGEDVYYSLACNGHGLAQATYIGSLIGDRIATGITPDDLRTIWVDEPKFGHAVPMIMGRLGLRAAWTADRFNDMINGSKRNARKGFATAPRGFAAPV